MATLTVQTISLTGLEPTYAAAAAGGDEFPNDGRTFLHVKNTNAATRTVTINSRSNCDQGFDHDPAVVIDATTGDTMIGPFDTARFNDPATGRVSVTYSAVTGVTVAAIKL